MAIDHAIDRHYYMWVWSFLMYISVFFKKQMWDMEC